MTFIVTCAGMSGSKWLAGTLNKHPEIYCDHSAGRMQVFDRDYSEKELKDILVKERAQFSGDITLVDFFKNIEASSNKLHGGNVHAYRLYRFVEAANDQLFEKNINMANLIRNPFAVTLSRQAMFLDMCKDDEMVRARMYKSLETNDELVDDILQKHKVNLEIMDNLCFLDAVKGLQRLSDEVRENTDVLHVKLENLLDATHFSSLIKHLVGDDIDTSESTIGPLVARKAINQHSKGKMTLGDRVRSLDIWQKEILRLFIERTSIIPVYESVGYTNLEDVEGWLV